MLLLSDTIKRRSSGRPNLEGGPVNRVDNRRAAGALKSLTVAAPSA
jgi:hypothetical protein